MKLLKYLTVANTVLVTAYFGLQVSEMLKRDQSTGELNFDEEKFKKLVEQQLGPEFLKKLIEVRNGLVKLRKEPVSLQSAFDFLKERKELDPILTIDG